MELITPRRYYDFINRVLHIVPCMEKYDFMRELERQHNTGKLSPLGFVLVLQKNFDINQMRDFGFCNSLHPVDHNIFLMHSLMLKRAGMRDR